MNIRYILDDTFSRNTKLIRDVRSNTTQLTRLWRFNALISEFLRRPDTEHTAENALDLITKIGDAVRDEPYGSVLKTSFAHLSIELHPLTGPLLHDDDKLSQTLSRDGSTESVRSQASPDEDISQNSFGFPRA